MRLGIILCLFVGLVSATNFKSKNVEYKYVVNGRILTGLYEVSDQYSGILYQAKLRIQPRSENQWMAQFYDAKMIRIHAHLQSGWKTYIPERELSWTPMELSTKPFEVVLKSGVIVDLVVSKDIPNWEANMLKGIMSQFQLDTKASEYISSAINILPEDWKNPSAVFKKVEETVTGNIETVYEINPLPEYVLQTRQYLIDDEDRQNVFQVVRHRNYDNSTELPSYAFRFGGVQSWEPATNRMGNFFVRNSVSRAILTGNLDSHIVRYSYTVNTIDVNPTLTNQQKGQVVNSINVTLEAISTKPEKIEEVSQPVNLGSLVYTYESPNSHSSLVHERKSNQNRYPGLNDAPGLPLLPYTIGYKGVSIKNAVDVMKSARNLALEIGEDMEDPTKILLESTLDKYTILTSLCRTMSSDEIQKTFSWLYTHDTIGSKLTAWQAFRDAVAQSGSGPALVSIQSWILSEKLNKEEASQLISTMANAAQNPTLEYLRTYFELIKSPVVESQWPLNNTAILSFGSLLRKSAVNKELSIRNYPSRSFGEFSTEESRKFVNETVIPYFAKKLEDAIAQAETQKIHVYIKTLGHIAHPQCLTIFQPYLEGKKQVSQFQRMLMVISLDKLVVTYPTLSRSIMFRIYQNLDDTEEMRVVAVYFIFRTNPPSDMLQLMAHNTHIDRHEHVNAAVKSLIERSTEMVGEEYEKLREAALSAKPLLSKKVYGVQHGGHMLRQYVYRNVQTMYTETLKALGSEDTIVPNAGEYFLGVNLNGLKHHLVLMQALVTNINELVHVGDEQTFGYQKKQKQQKEHIEEQLQHPWSSQTIARLLNLKADEREQLEGGLYLEFAAAPYKMFAFDNRTIEELPDFVRQVEETLKSGGRFDTVKFTNELEMVVSFPTDMGFPFIFSYDNPILYTVTGEVNGIASPKMSEGGKLHMPQKVNFKSDMEITVTSKMQGRLSFLTPFDHQQYISGYDKHFQVHVPLHTDVEVDVEQMQLSAEVKVEEPHKNSKLLHYSTWPYTSSIDVLNLRPIANDPNTHIILQQNLRNSDKIFGAKSTGIALRVEVQHEREFFDTSYMLNLFKEGRISDMLMNLWSDGSIQYSHINVSLMPEQCTTSKAVVKLGYQQKYMELSQSDGSINWKQYKAAVDALDRQQILMDKVSFGIKDVNVRVVDASIQFKGQRNIEYSATAALGKSNVDPKSHLVMYYKKSSDDNEINPYGVSFETTSKIPNTNALDLEYSLRSEPKMDTEIDIHFGPTKESLSRIQAQLQFRRSQNRVAFLQEQPLYKRCHSQMLEGNKQMHACVNMTMESNLLDRLSAKINYEKLSEELVQNIRTLCNALQLQYFFNIEENKEQKSQANQVVVDAHFDGDLRSLNVSIKTEEKQRMLKNIPINEWTKAVVVPHPVFHIQNRLTAKALELSTYRYVCVVDKSMVSTFTDMEYPVEISNHWTVMLQYVPKEARHEERMRSVEEQLKSQLENYAILVRKNSQNDQQKDVKLTLSTPQTQFKIVDITMTPNHHKVSVSVNGVEIPVSTQKSYDINGGYIQIYALPNGEVKVEVSNGFYIIYDGQRVRVTTTDVKYKNSILGLCGQFTEESTDDFLTSQNCYARDLRKFVKNFEVEGEEGREIRSAFAQNILECVPKISPMYTNVIPNQKTSGKCSRSQTRYVADHGQICFTTEKVTMCTTNCQARDVSSRSVPVHCVRNSNVAQLWKSQIDNGASPSFSHKKVTKHVAMQVPESCETM